MSEAATVHPELTIACANHPMELAVTRCKSCSRRLCSTCWRRTVDGEPWCEPCVADLQTGARARWPLAVTLLAVAVIATAVGWRRGGEGIAIFLMLFDAILIVVATSLVLRRGDRPHGRTIAERAPDDEPAHDASALVGHPYRTRLRRAAKLLAPPLSGRATAAVVGLCLVLCAFALPNALGLPSSCSRAGGWCERATLAS